MDRLTCFFAGLVIMAAAAAFFSGAAKGGLRRN